ncbi:MAG: nitroreductase family deazaflavin-dependent oxidoreductase [Pseudomonadales bacterium]|nr:nitroreductase family deazaflavin-dependent oxidoreductase [Pseudomonadales bacterium]
MDLSWLEPEIREALSRDRTIDIVTTGARTGRSRTTEIWFTRVGKQIIICGTPGATGTATHSPRDWLANLKVNPDFWFCLKESIQYALPAVAREVTDHEERRHLMSAEATKWYRDQVDSIDSLVQYSPIVDVTFRRIVPPVDKRPHSGAARKG